MDLNSFLKSCHEKVNLNPAFVFTQCDTSTFSYIQPFCSNSIKNPLVGYIHVSIIFCVYLKLLHN